MKIVVVKSPKILKGLLRTIFKIKKEEIVNKLYTELRILADILKEYLEKSACRSAVKANDILSQTEIETLLNMLNAENQILLCPHGRPVIIEVTEKEIEKWFKRIV